MILNRIKPLFYNSNNELVVSKGHKVYTFNKNSNKYNYLFEFSVPRWKKILSASKLWSRLFRYGVMTAIEYNGAYYFTFERHIYRYDCQSCLLKVDYRFVKGRGPLNFTIINELKGFRNGLYFGEYIANRSKNEVNVFRRTNSWEVVYTFPKGELNHIHGLVVDKISNSVWLLAGDFSHSAAIYSITDDFNSVEAIVKGEQQYRACVAFPTNSGLLYATDTQMEKNSIRLLQKVGEEWVSKKLFDLNGSCIYGGELNDYFVFSTATEPCEKAKNKLKMLFDNKPAPAIENNRSDVVICSKKSFNFNVIREYHKDIFPFRLFQFGVVSFPAGVASDNCIYMYSVGGKEVDLGTEFIDLDKN
jgi:hypothetical protein